MLQNVSKFRKNTHAYQSGVSRVFFTSSECRITNSQKFPISWILLRPEKSDTLRDLKTQEDAIFYVLANSALSIFGWFKCTILWLSFFCPISRERVHHVKNTTLVFSFWMLSALVAIMYISGKKLILWNFQVHVHSHSV